MGDFLNTEMMKKHRKSYMEKEIAGGILFLAFCILGGEIFTSNWILLMYALFYITAENLILEKHLSYPNDTIYGGFLAGVVKYHAFDTDSYFRELGKKIGIVEVIMAVSFSISMAVQHRTVLIPVIILLLLLPAVIFYGVRKFFYFRLTHELSGAATVYLMICYGLVVLVQVIVLLVFALGILIVAYGMVSDATNMKKLAEEVVAYRVYDSFLGGVMVISFSLYVAFSFFFDLKKIKKYVSAALLIVTCACFGGSLVLEKANNTLIMENRIIHTANFTEKEYDFSQVDSVKVSMGSSQINMELLMKDGVTIKVVGDEYTNTEAWGEKYYSIYNFLSDLTDRLLTLGAKGSISDVEAIRTYVKSLDPECVRGTEEVIQMLQ